MKATIPDYVAEYAAGKNAAELMEAARIAGCGRNVEVLLLETEIAALGHAISCLDSQIFIEQRGVAVYTVLARRAWELAVVDGEIVNRDMLACNTQFELMATTHERRMTTFQKTLASKQRLLKRLRKKLAALESSAY